MKYLIVSIVFLAGPVLAQTGSASRAFDTQNGRIPVTAGKLESIGYTNHQTGRIDVSCKPQGGKETRHELILPGEGRVTSWTCKSSGDWVRWELYGSTRRWIATTSTGLPQHGPL